MYEFYGFTYGLGHILGAIVCGLGVFGVIAFFVKRHLDKDIMPKEMRAYLEALKKKADEVSEEEAKELRAKIHELEAAAERGLDQLYKKFKEMF